MNWEIITFIAYFVILLGVALVFYFNGTNKNSEDFFLGGRSMGPWVTALSAQASDMSAWLLMGLPGSILAFGFGQMWIGIGLALGTAANWILCAKRLRTFSKAADDAITLPQYLTNRFATDSRSLQLTCALIFLFAYTIYVASALVAGTSVFTTLFPTGKGFADVCFIPREIHLDKPAVLIELKWDKSAAGALSQIKEKQYTDTLKQYQGNLLLVGINYDKITKEHTCVIEKAYKDYCSLR